MAPPQLLRLEEPATCVRFRAALPSCVPEVVAFPFWVLFFWTPSFSTAQIRVSRALSLRILGKAILFERLGPISM
jgi:hypothetical protein